MKQTIFFALLLVVTASAAFAGGPMLVGSPHLPYDGQPITWNPAQMPIKYTIDPGPLSQTASGTVVIDNKAGGTRVDSFFAVWAAAPDAALSFSNLGVIKSTTGYTGGDVKTADQFNAVSGSCGNAEQSPIVFDADGTIFKEVVGDPRVIGFAGPCASDGLGHIVTAQAALNGAFQDGTSTSTNLELTRDEFDAAFIHEFGHFLGLDHSQINVYCLDQACSNDEFAGLPTMFPYVHAELKTLATDDLAWISKLYPKPSFNTNYGKISGTVYFSDGLTPAQGVNVIARRVDDPATPQDESRTYAVSVVSGFRFTGNPGQSLTEHYAPCIKISPGCPTGYASNNAGGDQLGSRSPALYGYYEISLPPGDYTIQVESVDPGFTDGSSVGPLDPPIPMPGGVKEYWDAGESATDNPAASTPIRVPAGGEVNNINIILNNTDPRNDQFETGWLLFPVHFAKSECEVRG